MSSETGARLSPALWLTIRAIAAALAGTLLVTLLCQIPAAHHVDVGRFDAGYVRGFYDPERLDLPQTRTYLTGSDGSARWTRAESYLLFPQAGLPAEVTLRLRGWRAGGPPPQVTILVDGREAYTGATTGEWQEIRLTLQQPSLKPEDVLITLRTDVAPISPGDPRPTGVLVDAAEYRTAGSLLQPYPAQLAWGALAGALLALVLTDTRWGKHKPWLRFFTPLRAWVAGMLLIGLAYLLLYRLQPVYPYPLRGLLPGVCALLGATMAVQHGPALAVRRSSLPDVLAAGGIAVWTAAIMLVAQDHVTLSVPGVEKDFRVFATRAVDLALVFRADGFYHLGYPFLLWCIASLTEGNVFLAARLIAACAGAVFLGASWVLARRVLGYGPALVTFVMLALNPFVVQYALYVGSDIPFAALCALTLALLAQWTVRKNVWLLLLAGVAAGFAFLVRHPGILLLPFGVLVILWKRQEESNEGQAANVPSSPFSALAFAIAFVIAIAPQVVVNVRDTGNPFYNQQAKNIWLAVYGDSDWGRWNEVSNDVSLIDIMLEDPARFAGTWWSNLRAFIGAGAESVGDAGQASQLRLLAFPANWLAVVGLVGWLALIGLRGRSPGFWTAGGPGQEMLDDRICAITHLNKRLIVRWAGIRTDRRLLSRPYGQPSTRISRSIRHHTPVIPPFAAPLLVWVALYAAVLAVGLPLQRFFLPLAPVYALAATWTLALVIGALAARWTWSPARLWIVGVLVFLMLLWQGFALGAREVLDRQPADEVAAIRLVQQTIPPNEPLHAALAPGDPVGKYSAIAHRIAPPEQGTRYLLHSSAVGPRPNGMVIATFGRYALVQVQP